MNNDEEREKERKQKYEGKENRRKDIYNNLKSD